MRSSNCSSPDAYDCILSKLQRASQKDLDDTDALFRSQELDAAVLRERHTRELRDYLIGPVERHDGTLERWIEVFETTEWA